MDAILSACTASSSPFEDRKAASKTPRSKWPVDHASLVMPCNGTSPRSWFSLCRACETMSWEASQTATYGELATPGRSVSVECTRVWESCQRQCHTSGNRRSACSKVRWCREAFVFEPFPCPDSRCRKASCDRSGRRRDLVRCMVAGIFYKPWQGSRRCWQKQCMNGRWCREHEWSHWTDDTDKSFDENTLRWFPCLTRCRCLRK